ncbi:MAG: CBS domain-containing protein [Nisaea sp.]|jgi:CBS domain-containing protein|uniref:CBS domain-containing protein n=1 Tax=Nisaea sp. TaxID=2024842 RepID=UPI001B0B7746|nr:CBS domain-containing protein [Nisaea sp.]MBO6560854.1 CBS domain-containing protein [Nisaea sp.]
MARHIVPDVVDKQDLSSLSPGDTVLAAAKLMTSRKIGALLVLDGEKLVGILSERDIAGRLVAQELPAAETKISAIMTAKPETIGPKASVMDALQRMQQGKFRHLPVEEDGKIIGMVSIRDIYAAVREDLEEAVLEREAFISGSGMAGLP